MIVEGSVALMHSEAVWILLGGLGTCQSSQGEIAFQSYRLVYLKLHVVTDESDAVVNR